MSPEYALHGRLSLKSDVYSFGVIILEIISGERNTNFHQSHHDAEDFLSYVSINVITYNLKSFLLLISTT